MEERELLKYALEHDMIDMSYVQEQIEMNKRKELLERHPYKIWEGKDGKWYTHFPDEEKGRILRKRKSKRDLEDTICEFWWKAEEEQTNSNRRFSTLRQVFPEWLKFKAARTDSTSYIKRITADWHKFYEKNEISDKKISSLDKIYLDTWAHTMIKKYGLTKKSYYNMSVILRQCLDYMVEIGAIEKNIFRTVTINKKMFVRKKKPESCTQVYLTNETPKIIDEMIRRFENNPRSTSPLAVILCFEIGVRIGELVCIKWSDIHGNYIRIQRQEVRDFDYVDEFTMKFKGFRVVEYTKSSDEYRDVYLTETAKDILNFIKQVNERYRNCCDDYIFVYGNHKINHYSIQSHILRGCKHIMIQTKSAHKIRKTYISTLIDAGVNIDEVRRFAGHSDERTTFGNYCFNRETSEETKKKLENALNLEKVTKGNHIFKNGNGRKGA